MKLNYLKSMLLMSSMLFVASCSQEELVSDSLGNTVEAKFTIETPEGINSRAVGDGTTVDKVKCVVYGENGDKMDLDQTLNIVGKKATYDIRLVKDQNYRIAFFAYNDAAKAYDVTDMKNIQVLQNQPSNIEGRDAFTAYTDVTEGQTMQPINRTVTLYRPFAQLNLGAYKDDIEAARKAGVVVTNTSVKVTNVYKTFSAYNDAVVGETSDMEFALNGLVDEDLLADINNDGTDEAYEYLALNYLLVGNYGQREETKALTDVTFTWQTADGKTNDPVTTFKNVPVQRNYRTNIIGWLLTNPAQFNIVIDEKFEKPDYNIIVPWNGEDLEDADQNQTDANVYEVSNGAQLAWVAQQVNTKAETFAGKTIRLMKDIDLGGAAWEPIGQTGVASFAGTFDGNGKTIYGLNVTKKGVYVAAGLFGWIENHTNEVEIKNLTIEGATVTGSGYDAVVVGYAGGKKVVINNVNVKDAVVSAEYLQVDAEGDKAGIIAGFINPGVVEVSNCSAGNCEVNAVRDAGQLVGCAYTNNTVTGDGLGVKVTRNFTEPAGYTKAGQNIREKLIGRLILFSDKLEDLKEYVVETETGFEISDINGMFWFAKQVNEGGDNFAGKTVKLTANVDLQNLAWEPIGQTGATEFKGVFDGDGKTIYNLTINNTDASANCATGLFGWIESHGNEGVTIKNLNVQGATIYGHHNVAVIAGYIYGTIEDCSVYAATIECVAVNGDANGDKCGAIAGYVGEDAKIANNVVCGAEISAGRDAGQVVGAAKTACVEGNKASDVTVTANDSSTGANIRNEVIGRVL